MLHYSVDNELMTELYQSYRQLKGADFERLHQLAAEYIPLLEVYELDERTVNVVQRLYEFRTEEELEEIETKLVHGYLTAKADLRKEQAEFKDFIMQFEGEERQALQGLSDYVMGQKRIPYKIRNRCLHIDVLNTPAMSLELDFEDVLIEDGRHPREIKFTHLAGECFEREETIRREDGTAETVTRPYYRLSFINGLSEGPYQTKESAFVFSGLRGSLHLYNYSAYRGAVDVNENKLPWRLIMHPLQAVLEKAQILGVSALDADELSALPLICVFYELIQFYLLPSTEAGIGRSLIRFDEEQAKGFAFSQEDLDAVCEYLASYDMADLVEWLKKAITDRMGFCRYWIQYASMKKSETLYKVLKMKLAECSRFYERHPLPLACRKHHGVVRRALNEYFVRHKWRGEFPCFRRVEPSNFLEVSNVYRKMYTYINEKQKAYYVDFIESVSEQAYCITAVAGYILLRDGEEAKDYCAVHGYFLDGGRRNSHIVGQITIDGTMTGDQVVELLNVIVEDTVKGLAMI